MTRYIALCKIIETGSFTKAAEALGYTQAAVSQMIRSLEEEFSFKLLVRTRTGIRLTPEGEKLFPLISESVYLNRELRGHVDEIRGLESGEVRIGALSSVSQNWLPKMMKDFNDIYTGIRFSVYQGDNVTIPEWIKTGMVDFGFACLDTLPGLHMIPLATDHYFAVFPANHRLADRKSVSLDELEREPLLMIQEGNSNKALEKFEQLDLSPEVKFRIQDDYTILSMVEQSFGVSVLPSMVLERGAFRIVAVPTDPPIIRTISLAYQNPEFMSIASKRFIEFLSEKLPDILSSGKNYTSALVSPIKLV